MKRRAFAPTPSMVENAASALGPEIWRTVEACGGKLSLHHATTVSSGFIRDLCERDGVHFPAVLAIVRGELPAFDNPDWLVYLAQKGRGKRPAVRIDSPVTAHAVLAQELPVTVPMLLPDGRAITHFQLEPWAAGRDDWDWLRSPLDYD